MKPHKSYGWVRCTGCGDRALKPSGIYLELLYPLEFFCIGCGRRTAYCTCGRGLVH